MCDLGGDDLVYACDSVFDIIKEDLLACYAKDFYPLF